MSLKTLGKDSLIYGFGHVVSRLITFLLLPIYTHTFSAEEYGVISLAYAFIGFTLVIYRYGMDTALMKFSIQAADTEKKSYISSIYLLQLVTSLIFSIILFIFRENICVPILGVNDASLISIIAVVIFLDNLWNHHVLLLRSENKSSAFIFFNLLNVVLTMMLNIIFIIKWDYGVSGVLIANLIASASVFIFSSPIILKRASIYKVNPIILKKVIKFGLPFLPAGLFTMIMELSNRYILSFMKGVQYVGLFSAGYKLGIFALVLVMGFNMGWTPYFLRRIKEGESKKDFAIIATIFLGLVGFVVFTISIWISDIIRFSIGGNHFIGQEFWSSEIIVPAVLFGYFFFGAYVIQLPGIYAKNITNWVPVFRCIGAVVNILLNILLIPKYGILGSAWATAISFFIMALAVYLKLYNSFYVNYNWLGLCYPVIAMLVSTLDIQNTFLRIIMPLGYILIWYVFIINEDEKKSMKGIL